MTLVKFEAQCYSIFTMFTTWKHLNRSHISIQLQDEQEKGFLLYYGITVSRPWLRLDSAALADQNRKLRVQGLQIFVVLLNKFPKNNNKKTKSNSKQKGKSSEIL